MEVTIFRDSYLSHPFYNYLVLLPWWDCYSSWPTHPLLGNLKHLVIFHPLSDAFHFALFPYSSLYLPSGKFGWVELWFGHYSYSCTRYGSWVASLQSTEIWAKPVPAICFELIGNIILDFLSILCRIFCFKAFIWFDTFDWMSYQ